MIDLSPFRDVRIDPFARTARVTGGSLLGALDHEAMSYDLVTPMGAVSHTGVGGLVTGGGFGRLARRFGMSIDNLWPSMSSPRTASFATRLHGHRRVLDASYPRAADNGDPRLMLLIWKGWGILVPVQLILVMVACQAVLDVAFGAGYYTSQAWTKEVAIGLAAASLYPVGRRLNRPIPWDHPIPGKKSVWPAQHTLFLVPYQHWAWLIIGLNLVVEMTS